MRQGLVSAVDWTAVRNILTSNDAEDAGPANGLAQASPMMCPTNPSATESMPAFDVAAAAALLDEAGYRAGSDGARTTPDGEPFTLTFLTDADWTVMAPMAEYIADQWKSIGVSTNIEPGDYWANRERMETQNDWQIAQDSGGFGIPSQYMEWSFSPGNGVAGTDNAEYAKTAEEAIAAPDAEQACALWAKAEAALWREADVVPIGKGTAYWAGRDGVWVDGVLTPESIRVG